MLTDMNLESVSDLHMITSKKMLEQQTVSA